MIRGGLILILAALAACAPARGPAGPSPGAAPILKARIVHIDTQNSFLVIDQGAKEGIRPGTTFDLFRQTETEMLPLGKAVFEKFLGQGTMSKLTIVSGEIHAMHLDDLALYVPKE